MLGRSKRSKSGRLFVWPSDFPRWQPHRLKKNEPSGHDNAIEATAAERAAFTFGMVFLFHIHIQVARGSSSDDSRLLNLGNFLVARFYCRQISLLAFNKILVGETRKRHQASLLLSTMHNAFNMSSITAQGWNDVQCWTKLYIPEYRKGLQILRHTPLG